MRVPPALLGLGILLPHPPPAAKQAADHDQVTADRPGAGCSRAGGDFRLGQLFRGCGGRPSANLNDLNWSAAIRTILFWTWFFLAWAGPLPRPHVRLRRERGAAPLGRARERAHVAQLRALHSQINPHFLFNSLNSVSALILDKDTEKAEEMVVKLARFLRLGLAADPTRKIPLELEIELQRSYLEIEQAALPRPVGRGLIAGRRSRARWCRR